MDSVTDDRASLCRVSPFGNLRIDAYVPLPEAYRSLSRPSSAPDAKAFPLRSFQLNLISSPKQNDRFASAEFWFSELCRLIQDSSRNCFTLRRRKRRIVRSAVFVRAHLLRRSFRRRSESRLSPRSLSTIASEFPSVALLVFPLFSFQCAAEGFCPWWAEVDSNHRPHDYQSCALAS